MLYALVAVLAVVVIAHIWLLDRKDKRERAERALLLQRIQAPHAAVAEHHAAAVPAEADQAGGLPMSDSEIAEIQEREKLLTWMEAVENGNESMLDDGVPR